MRFAKDCHKTAEGHRAFRFMIGSGRPEFAASVWETLASKGAYDHSANFEFGWFAPSVLGPRAFDEYAKLPDDQRRSLLWDLIRLGGQEGIDFALEACRSEPSAKIVRTVLDLLYFGGANVEFEALLSTVSAEVWKLLAVHHRLSHADGAFVHDCWKKRRSSPPRHRLVTNSTSFGNSQIRYNNPEELIALSLESQPKDYRSEYAIFEPLGSKYPKHLSRAIIERLLRGETLPIFASRFVGIAPAEHQEALRAIALGTVARDARAKEAAARALNLESARSIIQRLVCRARRIRRKRRNSRQ